MTLSVSKSRAAKKWLAALLGKEAKIWKIEHHISSSAKSDLISTHNSFARTRKVAAFPPVNNLVNISDNSGRQLLQTGREGCVGGGAGRVNRNSMEIEHRTFPKIGYSAFSSLRLRISLGLWRNILTPKGWPGNRRIMITKWQNLLPLCEITAAASPHFQSRLFSRFLTFKRVG